MKLLEREAELAAIDEFLATAGLRVLLLVGGAGIGKSALLGEGRVRARERAYRVLSARPVEAEAALGYAALVDLFADLDRDVLEVLPGPQRHALQVALLREEAGERPVDPLSVASATLGVLRTMAEAGPVLLAVDDLGWVDVSTWRVLAFVLRRLDGEPIRLLATSRTERGGLPALPTDEVDPARVRSVIPRALSVEALGELLTERLDFVPSRRMLVRIAEASGGNPYFAVELARPFATGQSQQPEVLRVPPTLRRLVRGRLVRMPTDVRDVLLLAALAPGTPPERVAPSAELRSRLEAAERADVVAIGPGEVVFTHPLLRSVLIEDAGRSAIRDAHRRLAATASTPGLRARHRALATDEPDGEVAQELEDAAHDAYLRAAPDTAAELAGLAADRTPPAATGDAHRRIAAAAEYRFESGDPAGARDLVGELAAEPGWPGRAGLLLSLAKYQRYCGDPVRQWAATLETALDEVGEQDPPLRLAIHLARGVAALNGGEADAMRKQAAQVAELAAQIDDRFLDAQIATGVALVSFISGEGLPSDLVNTALAEPPALGRVAVEESPTFNIAWAMAHSDQIGAARELLERDRAAAIDRGDEASLPILDWLLVRVETWAGNWELAGQRAAEGLRAAELASGPVAMVHGARAILRAAQGRITQTRADAGLALEIHARTGLVMLAQLASEALGLLELSLGDANSAVSALRGATEQATEAGWVEVGVQRTLPLEIEARLRAGDTDGARHLLDRLATGKGRRSPSWSTTVEQRCAALLLAATGDLDAATRAANAAVTDSSALQMPFEHARTLLIAGEIHRRARHRRLAQQCLTDAAGIFTRLGAQVWAARCEDEMARLPGRKRSPGASQELTGTEQRIATLAAEGATTREIAAATFTSARTVEAHLHRIYQKLGVHSRVELALRLTTPR